MKFMSHRISRIILGCFDLVLATGAIFNGSKMVLGAFWGGEFPDVWLGRVPFTSWFFPGVIAITLYGLGNLISTYFSFSNKEKGWIASGIMGIFFFMSLLLSIKVLGEVYLATGMLIILSIVQIFLTATSGIICLIERGKAKEYRKDNRITK